VEEGLQVLAEGGPDAVRVEVLAKRIGVTKGGFYGYFADREALLRSVLDAWERECVDEVLERVEREGGDPMEKARLAGELTFSGDRLLPIDLAVRNWARRDEAVAERLRRVDDRRMGLVREMFAMYCDDPDEVEARSMIAFCVAIGQHFLPATHEGRSRAEVLAWVSDLVLNRPHR
jgi:AcrR family transcriptional regulator